MKGEGRYIFQKPAQHEFHRKMDERAENFYSFAFVT